MSADDLPLDPGPLSDGDLELLLVQWHSRDEAKGWVPWYEFALRVAGHPTPVGSLHLRVGDTEHLRRYAGHLGYGVDPAWRGHRLAARALRLVLPFAERCGIDPIWVTCNPDNLASIRTLELAGAERVGEVDLPPDPDMYQEGERRKLRFRFRLTRGDAERETRGPSA